MNTQAKTMGLQSSEHTKVCFICDKDLTKQDIHKARSMNLDANVRKMVKKLGDSKLKGKLSEGDMHARDTVYHKHCMTKLHTR